MKKRVKQVLDRLVGVHRYFSPKEIEDFQKWVSEFREHGAQA